MPASNGIADSSILIDHLRGQSLAARHLARSREAGQLITHAVVIATIRVDLPIITLNDKHFAAVPGLRVIRPY